MIFVFDSNKKICEGSFYYALENIPSKIPLFPKLLNVDITATEYSNKKRVTVSNGRFFKLCYDLFDYGTSIDIVRRYGVLWFFVKIIMFLIYVISVLLIGNPSYTSYKLFIIISLMLLLFIYSRLFDIEYRRQLAVFYTNDSLAVRYKRLVRDEKNRRRYYRFLDAMKIENTYPDDDDVVATKESDLSDSQKRIVKIGKVISIISVLFGLGCVVWDVILSYTPKYLLMCYGLSPVPFLIYALIFKDRVSFAISNNEKLRTNKYVTSYPLFVPLLSGVFVLMHMTMIGQVYKGIKSILIVIVIFEAIILLIGFIRLRSKNYFKDHFAGYIIYVTFMVIGLVAASFYATSSKAEHVPCEYVSKSHTSGSNSGYYITVKLQDGSVYKSKVGRRTYENAETADLVSCHRDGLFGVEYLRVHASDEVVNKDKK